jgi:aspartyl-tRNA(Asn)/glutamyl-tRNA(Gln) amidotransferase subunit B
MAAVARLARLSARARSAARPLSVGASTRPEDASPEHYAVVGLEVHVQIDSASKLFSGAAAATRGSSPNVQVGAVDAALPGALPVANAECVRQAARVGLALGGAVQRISRFDRKHYFYPDLPLGFQITQHALPIVRGGALALEGGGALPYPRTLRFSRVQLEQDSGKSTHDLHATRSYVDLNRAGVGLLELVSEPDLRSAREAEVALRKLQTLLRHIGASRLLRDEGSIRCDVNVSITRRGLPGERVEVKNLNSIRTVVRAIEHEVARQSAALERGERIERETRTFDASAGVTTRLRAKEALLDYRFLPEPDLPPLMLSDAWLREVEASLGELPDATVARWRERYGLSEYDCRVMVEHSGAARFFDALVGFDPRRPDASPTRDPKRCVSWLTVELFGRLVARGVESVAESEVGADRLGALVDLVETGRLSGKQAKEVLDAMLTGGDARSPGEIASERGWSKITDESAIASLVDETLRGAYASELAKYLNTVRAGKPNPRIVGFLVGRVIAASRGQADPKLADRLVRAAVAEAERALGPERAAK